mgnify:CR=1 FL=1
MWCVCDSVWLCGCSKTLMAPIKVGWCQLCWNEPGSWIKMGDTSDHTLKMAVSDKNSGFLTKIHGYQGPWVLSLISLWNLKCHLFSTSLSPFTFLGGALIWYFNYHAHLTSHHTSRYTLCIEDVASEWYLSSIRFLLHILILGLRMMLHQHVTCVS